MEVFRQQRQGSRILCFGNQKFSKLKSQVSGETMGTFKEGGYNCHILKSILGKMEGSKNLERRKTSPAHVLEHTQQDGHAWKIPERQRKSGVWRSECGRLQVRNLWEVEEVVWGTRTLKRQHKVCLKCNPGQGVMNNQFVLENSGIINKGYKSIVQGKYWHDWRGTRKLLMKPKYCIWGRCFTFL